MSDQSLFVHLFPVRFGMIPRKEGQTSPVNGFGSLMFLSMRSALNSERAERQQDYQRADAIKRANPASWKHVNLYGAYSFLDIGDGVDLQELVNLLEAARGGCAAAPD